MTAHSSFRLTTARDYDRATLQAAAIAEAQRRGLVVPKPPSYGLYLLVALAGAGFAFVPTLLIGIYAAVRRAGYTSAMNQLMLTLGPRR